MRGSRVRGLSPRVRGNLPPAFRRLCRPGSIPACAGEPLSAMTSVLPDRVYPRVCGGTAQSGPPAAQCAGLSPRVRGNLDLAGRRIRERGSIPACAGEPKARFVSDSQRWVYPRVCGGTVGRCHSHNTPPGLSPRVRGNHPGGNCGDAQPGSIPACAGEPQLPPPIARRIAVYPRVCGGTPLIGSPGAQPSGLSPRVRGNLLAFGHRQPDVGSIPACAGEPGAVPVPADRQRVYPRVCGGTALTKDQASNLIGLSPRVRGNPGHTRLSSPRVRSIPACAGEPVHA